MPLTRLYGEPFINPALACPPPYANYGRVHLLPGRRRQYGGLSRAKPDACPGRIIFTINFGITDLTVCQHKKNGCLKAVGLSPYHFTRLFKSLPAPVLQYFVEPNGEKRRRNFLNHSDFSPISEAAHHFVFSRSESSYPSFSKEFFGYPLRACSVPNKGPENLWLAHFFQSLNIC